MKYTVICDGGCSRNGFLDAKAYGSYAVLKDGVEVARETRMEFDAKTNNVAEYMACVAGIRRAIRLIGQYVNNHELLIITDSEHMVKAVSGEWKLKHERLIELRKEIWELSAAFGKRSICHVPREEIVRVLGH